LASDITPSHLTQHQQLILNIFRTAFTHTLSSESFASTRQEIQRALFNREFAIAFGQETNLDVYAARWSPTRTLCYSTILRGIESQLKQIFLPLNDGDDTSPPVLRVVSIGGAAAELVALGSFLSSTPALHGSLCLIDSGPWEKVVQQLHLGLTTAPVLSKYASTAAKAAKAANAPMVDPAERLAVSFVQQDALALGRVELSRQVGSRPALLTLFFTLNELFTAAGIGKTTVFLLDVTATLPVGSLLLVVDSPGSYSETVVGKQAKRYPMQWLTDKILLPPASGEAGPVEGRAWTKLESHDSIWFRLSEKLDYPIDLEDMRYQMHLYRLVNTTHDTEETSG
jgi:25S rRNA (uracil2843-N3)-methyltransferase